MVLATAWRNTNLSTSLSIFWRFCKGLCLQFVTNGPCSHPFQLKTYCECWWLALLELQPSPSGNTIPSLTIRMNPEVPKSNCWRTMYTLSTLLRDGVTWNGCFSATAQEYGKRMKKVEAQAEHALERDENS